MRAVFTILRTVVYATVFLAFFAWMALRVRSFDRNLGLVLPAGAVIPGVLLMGLGGILALTCIALFVSRGRGTPAPFDAPKEFVASGPYRDVRNPM
jgi:protein-S-isoprenylcysteine O-methyltransferase Ste14